MQKRIPKDTLMILFAVLVAAALIIIGLSMPARAAESTAVPDKNLRTALGNLLGDPGIVWPASVSAAEFALEDSVGWHDAKKTAAALELLDGDITLVDNAQAKSEAITNLTGLSYMKKAASLELSGLSYLTTIHTGALKNMTVLKSVSLPAQIKSIQANAFEGCAALISVKLPERSQLTVIGQSAFLNCAVLAEFDFTHAPRLSACMAGAFSGCGLLETADLSQCLSLKTLNAEAFKNATGLRSVSLPSGLALIMQGAFEGCARLSSVNVPDETALTTLSTGAFKGCSSLTSFDFKKLSKLRRLGSSVFEGCKALLALDFSACGELTAIDASSLYGISGLSEVRFPAALTEIQAGAFENCTALTNVIFAPNSAILEIGAEAFRNCRALEGIDFTNCALLASIGQGAFRGCSALNKLVLPNSANVQPFAFTGTALSNLSLFGNGEVDESLTQPDTFPYHFLKEENQKLISLGFKLKEASALIALNSQAPTAKELKERFLLFTADAAGNSLSLDYGREMIWFVDGETSDRYLLGDVDKSLYIASVFNNTAVTFLGPDKKAESEIDTSVPGAHTAIFLLAETGRTLTTVITVSETGDADGSNLSEESGDQAGDDSTEPIDAGGTEPVDDGSADPAGDGADPAGDGADPAGDGAEPVDDGVSDENNEPGENTGEEPANTEEDSGQEEQNQSISAPFPKFGQVTLPTGQLTVPMRPEASHSKPPVISLKAGMIVAVVGQTGDWFMAQYGDYAGFVSKNSLLPPTKTTFTGKVTVPLQADVTEFPLYAAPDSDGDPIRLLAAGTTVTVTGVTDGWYEITAGSDSGYMQIIHLVLS